MQVMAIGAYRQSFIERKIVPKDEICCRKLLFWSIDIVGTISSIAITIIPVAAIHITKAGRHPRSSSNVANGMVANIPPIPVAPIRRDVARGRRPGSQIDADLIPAIRLADMPIPIRTRPRIKPLILSADMNSNAPIHAVVRSKLVTAFGP